MARKLSKECSLGAVFKVGLFLQRLRAILLEAAFCFIYERLGKRFRRFRRYCIHCLTTRQAKPTISRLEKCCSNSALQLIGDF
jgi:hypothetical protein